MMSAYGKQITTFSQYSYKRIPVSLSNCSPNEITGIADAKNIYVVGAKILGRIQQVTKLKSAF